MGSQLRDRADTRSQDRLEARHGNKRNDLVYGWDAEARSDCAVVASPQDRGLHDLGRRALLRLLASTALTAAAPRAASAGVARLFAPGKSVDPRWTGHEESDARRVDHSAFDNFLKRYTMRDRAGIVRVRYADVAPSDRRQLGSYVQALKAVTVTRLASILDIDISPGLFARGPWGKPLFVVEGNPLTLNEIEHRILRPIWSDPLIHYALNCAAVGCPNLRPEAFAAASAPTQLDAGARDYINDPRGARIVDGRLRLSSIYDWFQEDFGGGERAVLAHLSRYAEAALASTLAATGSIAGYDYDWSLNDARNAA